jgi:FKBP-type peptidyl-prolyl cis-trans isomerase
MKKTSLLLSVLTLLLLGSACKTGGFKKTKSGLMYKIIPTGSGPVVKRGDIIKINFVQKLRDSILGSTYDQVPAYQRIDSIGPVYHPQEIFGMLRKGDSAVVIMMADSLAKKQGGMLPDFIKPKDKLVLSLRVVDVFTADSLAQKDNMAEVQKNQQRQQAKMESLRGPKAKEIEDYLAKNNIKYQKTPGGTYVEVKDPGNGMPIDSGKHVSVRYTGKNFPSMKVFQSNMDGKMPAFDLVIDAHGAIPGFDEGLKYFKKGGKGTLYIPFFQAYGPQQGPGGSQYENLVFDIVVDDVSDSAKKEPMPAMPPQSQTPPQGRK